MKRLLLPLLALLFLLTGCQTLSRVDKRITANPEWFNKLSTEHREAVQQGLIREGMSREGVFLAWGRADRVQKGFDGEDAIEAWIYETWEPRYTRSISVGVGYGGYCHPGYGYGYGGYGWWPGSRYHVDYERYPEAIVRFRHDKVEAWTTEQR